MPASPETRSSWLFLRPDRALHWNPAEYIGHELFIPQQAFGKRSDNKPGRNQVNPDVMLGPFYCQATGHLVQCRFGCTVRNSGSNGVETGDGSNQNYGTIGPGFQ